MSRTLCTTEKVETEFGALYVQIDHDELGRPVGGTIASPGKEPRGEAGESQIGRLVAAISDGLDRALREVGYRSAEAAALPQGVPWALRGWWRLWWAERSVAGLARRVEELEADGERCREALDLMHGRIQRLRRLDGNVVRELEALEGMAAWYLGRPGPFGEPGGAVRSTLRQAQGEAKKKSEGEG